jgi:hypothetical protein
LPSVTADDALPPYIAAFRYLFRAKPKGVIVMAVWRSLLPSMSQLWYRMDWMWTARFPFRLLLLVSDQVSGAAQTQVCIDLLTAPMCCIEPGFSAIIRSMALSLGPDQAAQIAFLRGRFVYHIIYSWALSIKPTIQDLENMNSMFRRFRVSGRPPDFATTAAKGSQTN